MNFVYFYSGDMLLHNPLDAFSFLPPKGSTGGVCYSVLLCSIVFGKMLVTLIISVSRFIGCKQLKHLFFFPFFFSVLSTFLFSVSTTCANSRGREALKVCSTVRLVLYNNVRHYSFCHIHIPVKFMKANIHYNTTWWTGIKQAFQLIRSNQRELLRVFTGKLQQCKLERSSGVQGQFSYDMPALSNAVILNEILLKSRKHSASLKT